MLLFRILPVLAVLLPLVEIFLFVIVGGSIGPIWTILEVILTAVVGLALLRRLGLGGFWHMRKALQTGETLLFGMLDTTFLAFGGVLLFVPGFFTDAVGLLLMVPLVRALAIRRVLPNVRTRRGHEADVIEVDYHVKSESDERKE